jgi:hypothetical protein
MSKLGLEHEPLSLSKGILNDTLPLPVAAVKRKTLASDTVSTAALTPLSVIRRSVRAEVMHRDDRVCDSERGPHDKRRVSGWRTLI